MILYSWTFKFAPHPAKKKKSREIPGRYKVICLLKWQFSDPTYFFVAENDTPIIEKGGLKSETAQVVIILQMYMVPLDN